jgi:glutamine amidotransferase-like uncharacterized protein
VTVRVGFVWENRQHFTRLIEECAMACEVVTPHMLAAPFFRGSFNCLIIPTGFGNPEYSNLLPALRASSPRIKRFVENGGNLLVFGAAIDNLSAYDWLPFPVTYRHECHPRKVLFSSGSTAKTIIQDYDAERIECDGSFPYHDGDPAGLAGDQTVVIEKRVGKGLVVVTSIHEFPSRAFLVSFCQSGTQTLF